VSEFRQGDRVRVVEHDDSTRQPRDGGRVYEATVEVAGNAYVQARLDDGKLRDFYQGSGWLAWDGLFRWRLMPAPADETAATTGQDAPR
jgi:hypothetical protein